MTRRLVRHAARLHLGDDPDTRRNLSCAAFSDDGFLWVASDESCAIERLQPLGPEGDVAQAFGHPAHLALADLLDLPGPADGEVDVEGLAVDAGYLWLVGSHGWKRKSPKDGGSDAKNARRLAKVTLDPNRLLLARVPIEAPGGGAPPTLVRKSADGRTARRLVGDRHANALVTLLCDDPHLGPFMSIPGKDNGFDIEGLAVEGARVWLGLRGPVLRGWALVLEIALAEGAGGLFELAPLDDAGTRLRKHFLDLEGSGVRDLHFDGDDLVLLAGPTMTLDGAVRVFTWRGARAAMAAADAPPVNIVRAPEHGPTLPHGRGTNRAEALCRLPPVLAPDASVWLALYDAPAPDRLGAPGVVFGDLLQR